jgi:hypothetical protein
MRSFRELEPPADDEGFADVEHVPFVRASTGERTAPGVFVAAAALGQAGWAEALAEADPQAPHLVFDWQPDGTTAELAAAVTAVATSSPAPWRRRSVLTPAARPSAGAACRFQASRSPRASARDRPRSHVRRRECAANARDNARRAARLAHQANPS